MRIISKLRPIGGSQGIIIEKEVLRALNLKIGDRIEVNVMGRVDD